MKEKNIVWEVNTCKCCGIGSGLIWTTRSFEGKKREKHEMG